MENYEVTKVSEITVTYNPNNQHHPTILCSIDAYVLFLSFFPKETIALQERFVVMYLNRSNKVLGIYTVSIGGITGTVADPRLILATGLKVAATAVMLAHNHPSGSLKPSQADLDITEKIKCAGKYLDISVIDHFIISPEDGKYLSFSDEGLL